MQILEVVASLSEAKMKTDRINEMKGAYGYLKAAERILSELILDEEVNSNAGTAK